MSTLISKFDNKKRYWIHILILFRFKSSSGDWTSLAEYVERMKDKQEQIFYIAGQSEQEVTESPFVERLLKKGYEVLYLTEAVDEYAISALPEFESKKFQNVAKEGVDIDGDSGAAKQRKEDLKERFVQLFIYRVSIKISKRLRDNTQTKTFLSI